MSEFDGLLGKLAEHNVKDATIDELLAHAKALLASRSGDAATLAGYQAVESAAAAKKGNKVIEYNDPEAEKNPAERLNAENKKEHNFAVEKEATEYLRETLPIAAALKVKKEQGTLTPTENKALERTLRNYEKISGLYPHKAKEISRNMEPEKQREQRTNTNVRTMAKESRSY